MLMYRSLQCGNTFTAIKIYSLLIENVGELFIAMWQYVHYYIKIIYFLLIENVGESFFAIWQFVHHY